MGTTKTTSTASKPKAPMKAATTPAATKPTRSQAATKPQVSKSLFNQKTSNSNDSKAYKFPPAVEDSLKKYCKSESSLSALKVDTKKYAVGNMDGPTYLKKLRESVGGNMNAVALDVIGSLPKGEARRALAQLYSQQ